MRVAALVISAMAVVVAGIVALILLTAAGRPRTVSAGRNAAMVCQSRLLEPGDSVMIDGHLVVVPRDGVINLPFVGRITVVSLTQKEVDAKIDDLLKKAGLIRLPGRGGSPGRTGTKEMEEDGNGP